MDVWTREGSPFHEGEQAVQTRLGLRDRMEQLGRRVIREFMPDQHRRFYESLSFLLLGSVDEGNRPWASILVGNSGFISSPDDRTLRFQARPLRGDPLNSTLKVGVDLGLLGIEPVTRRRNRMNGVVTALDPDGLTIQVKQAFGNCPQYIQKRRILIQPELESSPFTQPHPLDHLGSEMQDLIRAADTLFVTTHYSSSSQDVTHGVDVSHRGGKPGFVRVDDQNTLTFPDFAGNLHFNTVGNLMLDPGIGVLFPDFASGDVVTLTGRAEIIWDGEEVRNFEGAERLFRIHVSEALFLEKVLPFQTTFEEYSPSLKSTGSWEETAARITAQQLNDNYRTFRVVRIEEESEMIRSFYLQPHDDQPLMGFEAGQSLPIRFRIPGQDQFIECLLPLSDASGSDSYRITLSRQEPATDHPNSATALDLYDVLTPNSEIEVLGPRGSFTLDNSRRPVVLVSSGVGISPLMAMLNQIRKQVDCCGIDRTAWFIHEARNSREHAFADSVRHAARFTTISTPILLLSTRCGRITWGNRMIVN
ncbi:MAG: hypothetical protein HC921_19240 [Synechococcaceae cyanobacterium SM2_3_1]|nr:hypothetical protein [Synechococcaceae cyanobacterium SM2_3_1]